jgi:hypothetical protein
MTRSLPGFQFKRRQSFIIHPVALLFILLFTSPSVFCQTEYIFQGDGKLTSIKEIDFEKPEMILSVIPDEYLKKKVGFPIKSILELYKKLKDPGYVTILKNDYKVTDAQIKTLREDAATWLLQIPDEIKTFYQVTAIDKADSVGRSLVYIPKDKMYMLDKLYYAQYGIHRSNLRYDPSKGIYNVRLNKPGGPYQLRLTNPVNFYVMDSWLGAHPLPAGYADNFKKYAQTKMRIEAAAKEIAKFKADIIAASPLSVLEITTFQGRITGIKDEMTRIKSAADELTDYVKSNAQSFILYWLWYTQGRPLLNPFSPPETVSASQEDSLFYYKKRLESVKVLAGNKNAIQAEDIIKLSAFQVKLESDISRLEEEAASAEKSAASRDLALQKDYFLYDGFALSSADTTIFYHDASNKFKLISSFTKEIPEDHVIYVAIENKTKPVVLEVATVKVSESTPFAVAFESIDFSFVSQIGAVFESADADSPINILRKDIRDTETLQISSAEILTKIAVHYSIEWIPKPELIEQDSSPSYKSEVNLVSDTLEAPRKVTYTLSNEGEEKKYAYHFRYNKLHLILPSAGIVYSFANEKEYTYANGTVTSEPKTGFIATAGLKIYPFRTHLRDPYFVYSENRTPKFDYRKFHFYLGVGTREPVKNFLFGAGLDFWSGVNINLGYHLLRLEQPEVSNNVVIGKNNYTKGSFYLGLGIDPVVFIKLVSLFSPVK